MEDKTFNSILLGALLKAHREHTELSQREVATAMGYRNYNFISMIESGRSNIPQERILSLVQAYELDGVMGLVILKYLYPNVYDLFAEMFDKHHNLLKKGKDKVATELEATLKKTLKEYGLENMLGE